MSMQSDILADQEVSDAVYSALRSNGEALTEFTSETLVGHLCGMLARVRSGVDDASDEASNRAKSLNPFPQPWERMESRFQMQPRMH